MHTKQGFVYDGIVSSKHNHIMEMKMKDGNKDEIINEQTILFQIYILILFKLKDMFQSARGE